MTTPSAGSRLLNEARVAKEMIAWQIQQAMKKGLTKKRMAELMGTSRTQVDRLLNPRDQNVTLAALERRPQSWSDNFGLSLCKGVERAATSVIIH